MKILVLGAGGMAGHVVSTYLIEQGHTVQTLSAKSKLNDDTTLLDVTIKSDFEEFLKLNTFDIVINCIGLLIEQSDRRKDFSSYINSYLPHYLEYFYKDSETRVIHLSTDCVFSGKNAPYRENSSYDGETFYDRSKALGEIINDKDLTFRMSIIGPDMQHSGVGLFNWFYAQTGEISGYKTAIWNGITTITLAHAINSAINQKLTGLYHLVPEKNVSKYDLLVLFKDIFDRSDINVLPTEAVSLNKTLLNTRDDFNYCVPNYSVMIEEMKTWILEHKELYAHYNID